MDGCPTKFYVGKISKLYENHISNKKFEVKFLRKSFKTDNFKDSLSEEQSVDDVDEADIVAILPEPSVRRGIYCFKYDFSLYNIE